MFPWEKGRVIGRGGSSTVYECIFLKSDEKVTISNVAVAVKEINSHGLSSQQRQVIQAEIDILKALSHPNIIKYIGTENTSNYFYILLEYAQGGSLRELYVFHGPLEQNVIIHCLRQVLEGLLYLHL